jgi:hypothetical protein
VLAFTSHSIRRKSSPRTRFVAAAIVSALTIHAATPGTTAASRDAKGLSVRTRTILENDLATFTKRLADNDPDISTSDVSSHAIEALLLDHNNTEIHSLMMRVFAAQNTDRTSPDFGSIAWNIGETKITDPNSNEFNALVFAALLTLGNRSFDRSLKSELQTSAKNLTFALQRRTFDTPAYTNIYLLNSVSLMSIGNALGDKKSTTIGRNRFDTWITYTQANGVAEFDAPTYSAVQLDALTTGYRLTTGKDRAAIGGALNLLWSDVAANFFGGGLSGAFSRSYDFIGPRGRIDSYYVAEGLLEPTNEASAKSAPNVFVALNELAGGYHPSANLLRSVSKPGRVVRSRFGPDLWQTRINEVTPGVAMSTIGGGSYGPQDRLFNITFATPGAANMSVVANTDEVDDSPYGKPSNQEPRQKPHHLPANITAVQRDGTALITYAFEPPKDTVRMTTNIVFPANADEVIVNNNAIDVRNMNKAPTGATFAIRVGQGCVALRVLQADSNREVAVFTDNQGGRLGVSRLTLRHDQPQPITRVALLVRSETCTGQRTLSQVASELAAAPAAAMLDRTGWRVNATIHDHRFDIERDLTTQNIVARRIDNAAPDESPILEVNGQDMSSYLKVP